MYKKDFKRFGDVLLEHLERKGISQKDFALWIGVDPTTINKIVKSTRAPSIEVFAAMAADLGPIFTLQFVEATYYENVLGWKAATPTQDHAPVALSA